MDLEYENKAEIDQNTKQENFSIGNTNQLRKINYNVRYPLFRKASWRVKQGLRKDRGQCMVKAGRREILYRDWKLFPTTRRWLRKALKRPSIRLIPKQSHNHQAPKTLSQL